MERIHLLLLLYFFQIYVCNMGKVGGLNATTDKQSLLSFRLKLSDPQNSLAGWKQNSSHCTWHGVSCSARGSRVQSLQLSGLGLSGTLPPQLSNLTSLHKLDLSKNSFHGQIPMEFGQLSHLQQISLSYNLISGRIPSFLSHCPELKTISFAHNQLAGNLPPELGHLPRLEILDVSINNLTGEIPSSFGNLSSLTVLSLAQNKFVGEIPSELGHLHNLQEIQFSDNQLSGEIPNSIYNISSLVFFSVTQNELTGKLPNDVGHTLPNLTQLFLAQNRLEGVIPSSLSNASKIQFLDLSYNSFEGPIPLVGNMKKLILLNLGNNSLSSTTELNFQLIESLKNCTQLEILKLFNNQMSGELPSSVTNLSTQLQQCCFANNFLTGSLPQGIENFHNLISLSMEGNFLTGEIPNTIGTLKRLQLFNAADNMFSGEIPDIFGNFTQLSILVLGNNNFSGRIPTSIGDCQQLKVLHLPENRLNGSIPRQIFGISTLIELNLLRNSLSGPFPTEVSNLKQLQYLDVSYNQLSGNLSGSIEGCSSLLVLAAASNNLTGLIWSKIGSLLSLQILDLSSNFLSGPIPKELENLDLQKLNLSFNDFEGEIPTKGVFMNLSQVSLQGNNMLCSSNHEMAGKLGLSQCIITRKSKRRLLFVIIVSVVSIILLLNLIFFFMWALLFRKKKNKRVEGTLSSPPLMGLPPMISYSSIRQATNDFAAENLIGKGGFGSVYKGVFISTNTTLAVKILDLKISKASQSFNAECEALRTIRHRNLVKVITSCSSIDHKGDEFKALVMDFMSNGNLDSWLYPQKESESWLCLTLMQRLNIAIDVASAMDYLHHDCEPPVVHCDLKPGNVLLDEDMVAHVGDFGLARFLSQNPSKNESSTIGLKGSIGYIAPEYGMGSKASTSGDVYCFGILLLEMFIAKRPTDEMFKEGLSLNKFALAVNENQALEIADPRLFNDNNESLTQSLSSSYYNSNGSNININSTNSAYDYWLSKGNECVAAVIRVGLSCTAQSAKDRLTMREALAKLNEIRRLPMKL